MNIRKTNLPGVAVVESTPIADHRGTFSRFYCEKELAGVIGNRRIVQINFSHSSSPGTVRGLHFQFPPYAEMKLVRCIKGRVWDVAADLRAGSPTFLLWTAEELTPINGRMMVIPEGCAHGFQVLEGESELLYLHTAFYTPEAEGGVPYNDPRLGIAWPLQACDISHRDSLHPRITSDFTGIAL